VKWCTLPDVRNLEEGPSSRGIEECKGKALRARPTQEVRDPRCHLMGRDSIMARKSEICYANATTVNTLTWGVQETIKTTGYHFNTLVRRINFWFCLSFSNSLIASNKIHVIAGLLQ
jgi:hypothetical protein